MANWRLYKLEAYDPRERARYTVAIKASDMESAKELVLSAQNQDGGRRFSKVKAIR